MHKRIFFCTFAAAKGLSLCIVVTKSNHLWTIITRKMQQVHAKKFLGQHFLTDLTVAQRIAETICAGPTLEIGPGMGVLTQYLLKNPYIQLTAIEIDRESVAYLKE